MIKNYHTHKPKINPQTYISKHALVIGRVTLSKDVSVWPGCVLRGDVEEILVGERTNLQEGVLVHPNHSKPVIIGQGVTIGHGAIIHGCKIGDGCLIGMGAVILDGAAIGDECIIGAGSIVTEAMHVSSKNLVLGMPGKIVRQVKEEEIKRIRKNTEEYVQLARVYKKSKI
ncbi:MAG: gamma carbonic anhydrase family protein [Elusimicrobia bacterium]|nr:gamma carbonic anhydrase family protein [Candidatus Liberimonas magnetica]